MLLAELERSNRVVVSGHVGRWGQQIEDAFDLVVFLYLPAEIRIERLRRRETERFGQADPAFLEWANGPERRKELGQA